MNKKRIIKILTLLVVLLLAWGIIWSYFITKTVRKNNADENMKNQQAIIKNIIVTETQDEKKYWEFLTADVVDGQPPRLEIPGTEKSHFGDDDDESSIETLYYNIIKDKEQGGTF